jgi:serine/threonine protein kinase
MKPFPPLLPKENLMAVTTESVCSSLLRSHWLPEKEVHALVQRWLAEAGPNVADGKRFLEWLAAGHHITSAQAQQLGRGESEHRSFGEYQVHERIGAGRMAGIFKAVHQRGQVVAIKVLPPSKAKDPHAFARFQREARLALLLKHPNIVRTFQTGTEGKLHYLVMEYLDGETLEEVLKRRGRLPADEAVRLIIQALNGLEHVHEKDMIHRDLKPANLMLVPAPAAGQPDTTANATLKILDIGVGRALFDEGAPDTGGQIDLTTQGEQLGAPDYMAPEQARDAHKADIRSDLYSLGCVLYHCLTGQPPFPGGNMVQKMMRHAREAPRPLRDFDATQPDGLQAVVSRMLAKDPAQRYATPSAVVRDLDAFLAGDRTTLPESAVNPEERAKLADYEAWLARSHRGMGMPAKLGIAACGLALVALVCWAVILFNKPRRSTTSPDVATAASFSDWVRATAALPVEQQAEAVAAKLKELNPEFDGTVRHEIQDGAVTELHFSSDAVTDLAPVTALSGLRRLTCSGSGPGRGRLDSLAPLRGLSLTVLDCSMTRVADLTPLQDMPLVFVAISGTPVRDLTPLKDMPLLVLSCAGTHVSDLMPLRGMALTMLDAADAPLADLTPLQGMPLQNLWCPVKPGRDLPVLRSLAAVKEINGKPAPELWKQAEGERKTFESWVKQTAALPPDRQVAAVVKELKERNPGFDGNVTPTIEGKTVTGLSFVSDEVTDLAPLRALKGLKKLSCPGSQPGRGKLASLEPLRGLKLTELECGWSHVADLGPLKGMPLTRLSVAGQTGVKDLSPLKGMPLTYLQLEDNAEVADLEPLKGMRLEFLNVAGTNVKDLTPLAGMPLTSLAVHGSAVNDLTPLKGLPLKSLSCDFDAARDTALLKSFASLERINQKPAADFWKEAAARPPAKPANPPAVAAPRTSPAKPKGPTPTMHFIGKVVAVQSSEPRSVTVETTEVIWVLNAHHLFWLTRANMRLLEVQMTRNPLEQLRRVQDATYQIGYHKARLYQPLQKNQRIELLADDAAVRVLKLPPVFDGTGKPRSYTAAELKEKKSPNAHLPGYHAEFQTLVSGLKVDAYLAPPEVVSKKLAGMEEKAVDPRPRLVYVVTLE